MPKWAQPRSSQARPRRCPDPLRRPAPLPRALQEQLEREAGEKGVDLSEYAKSMVVQTSAPKALGTLRAADGAEGLQSKA